MITPPLICTKTFFENASKRNKISPKRRELLIQIAQKIAFQYLKNNQLNLIFISTHNSRCSQLGQVWAFFASEYFNLHTIHAFSGGTKATYFHRNTLKTLQTAGFMFHLTDFSHQNPKYLISTKQTNKSILAYSKGVQELTNKCPFITITTCNNSDKDTPFMSGAVYRFDLPITDPKFSDETQKREAVYLKTNQQIAAELFFLFSELKQLIC
jgi:arsenate reductase